ncbi:MAG: VanZ family protein [Candidatus Thiodiazotropha sp.]
MPLVYLRKFGLLLLVLIVTVTMLLKINLPGESQLMHSLQDSGHFLIFALLTLVALWSYRQLSAGPLWPVAVVIFLFGIAMEAVQSLIGREPSLYDIFMDLLGIAAGAMFYAGFIGRSVSIRRTMAALLILTLAAFSQPMQWLLIYQVRADYFPRLIDPDSYFSRALIEGDQGGEVRYIDLPAEWSLPLDTGSDSCAYVSLHKGRWPGLDIQDPEPDWRGYESLELSIYSDQSTALPLVLRINDEDHNRLSDDRYSRRLLVQPGYNHFSLPLSEIAEAPRARTMDLGDISDVMIFTSPEYVGSGFCLLAAGLH